MASAKTMILKQNKNYDTGQTYNGYWQTTKIQNKDKLYCIRPHISWADMIKIWHDQHTTVWPRAHFPHNCGTRTSSEHMTVNLEVLWNSFICSWGVSHCKPKIAGFFPPTYFFHNSAKNESSSTVLFVISRQYKGWTWQLSHHHN